MIEYNLYKKGKFAGTYEIDKLSQKIRKTPSEIEKAIAKNNGIIDDVYSVGIVMSKKEQKEPLCKQMKTNCFANRNGYCNILTNTSFKRDCPFFKTEKGENNGK